MFCNNCGKKLDDGVLFCSKCGQKVEVGVEKNEDSQNEKVVANNGTTSMKGKFKKPSIFVILAVSVLLCALVVVSTNKKTLNVEDYIVIKCEGVDGHTDAYVHFDNDKFEYDFFKYAKVKNNTIFDEIHKEVKKEEYIEDNAVFSDSAIQFDLSRYDELVAMDEILSEVKDSIEYELDKSSNISNGDKITCNIQLNQDIAKKYGLKMSGNVVSITAENLSNATEVDLFKDLEITFEGISPYISLNYVLNSQYTSYVNINFDKTDNISKGDKVVVTFDVDEERLIKEQQCIPKEISKEYVCEDVDSYVMTIDQISEDQINAMKKEGQDDFRAEFSKNWENSNLESFEYIGSYLLTRKPTASGGNANLYYLIFKVNADIEGIGKQEYYRFVKCCDLIITKDGVCSVDLSNKEVSSYTWWEGGYCFEVNDLNVAGFKDIDTLFNTCVTQNIDNYEYSTSGDVLP